MMTLSINQGDYRLLDIMKFVMAIVVVAIHSHPDFFVSSEIARELIGIIYTLAVPFFFMASGFLLFRKIDITSTDDTDLRLKTYIYRICKLYIVWTIIYMPLTIYGFIKDGSTLIDSMLIFIRNFFLVGENYMSWPLWYLLALIVSVIIIKVLLKLKFTKIGILLFGVCLAIIGVLLDYCKEHNILPSLVDVYFALFSKTRNGFFVGLLYVSLGMWCSKLKNMQLITIAALLIIGVIGCAYKLPLANTLIVLGLFILTVVTKINITPLLSYKFRLISTIVYLIHMIFISVLQICFNVRFGLFLFASAYALSLIASIVLIRFKETKLFKMLF